MTKQLPPTEHWRGHLNVPRPPGVRRSPRAIIRAVCLAMLIGLITLWLAVAVAPDWGVMLIAGGSLLVAAGLASPLPISLDFIGAEHPEPLLAPALVALGFGAPAMVAAVIGIVTG